MNIYSKVSALPCSLSLDIPKYSSMIVETEKGANQVEGSILST